MAENSRIIVARRLCRAFRRASLSCVRGTACAIIVFVFLASVFLRTGVQPTASAPGDAKASIISIDVCGGAGGALGAQSMDPVIYTTVQCCFIPTICVVSPEPVKAVASALPGETDRPPEA